MPMWPLGLLHVSEICERTATSFGLPSWRWLCERKASWMTRSPAEPDGRFLPGNLLRSPTRSARMESRCDGWELHIRALSIIFQDALTSNIHQSPILSISQSRRFGRYPCLQCRHSRGSPVRMKMGPSEFSGSLLSPLWPVS
jgi:hypothetical protein